MIQLQTQEKININFDVGSDQMQVNYVPKTKRTLFDICDIHGRIIKTGNITNDKTTIKLEELACDHYILLILDGDRVCSRKFSVKR